MTFLPRRRRGTSSTAQPPAGESAAQQPPEADSETPAEAGRPAVTRHTAAASYTKELHRYLARRLRNPQDVDDMAQEVYLRLLRVDESQKVRRPLSYLYGIAAHVVADFLEAGREREQLNVESDDIEQLSDDASRAHPDDLAERLNIQQQLESALRRLPPLQAAILVLHKRDGYSYREVAAKLGISAFTVEKYLTRARAFIRAIPWDPKVKPARPRRRRT